MNADLELEHHLQQMLARRREPDNCKITIEGKEAVAVSPEGKTAKMPLNQLLAKLAPVQARLERVILPDGVKASVCEGSVVVWVWEVPPNVYSFDWIAKNSPAPFGRGTRYRRVRIALPYLVMLAVFAGGMSGELNLTSSNECFFRNGPLKSFEDELCYPALLNCSKFPTQEGHALSWICTQHLHANAAMQSPDLNTRLRAGFDALRHCLLETAFNYSSEHHEGASWFSESRKADLRIDTIEAWQEATEKDPMFVLDVPWLRTGFTLGQVVDRIFKNHGAGAQRNLTAGSLARIIFNHK